MKKKFVSLALALILSLAMGGAIYAAQKSDPVELAADTIEYDSKTGIITARGQVKMTQANAVLTGMSAEYNSKTREGVITGGVRVIQDDAVLTAQEVRSYTDSHITAIGDVVLTKGESRLTGPKIDYWSDKQYAVVSGGGRLISPDGVMTADKIEAFLGESRAVGTGNVHIVSDARKLDATAGQAVYYGAKEGKDGKAVLSGNARAVQDGNVLTGSLLTIYLDDKAMDAQGRTRLVIRPQQ